MGTELCIHINCFTHYQVPHNLRTLFLVTPSQPNISIVTASKNGQGI